jgi:hypothetical protein
MHVVFGNNHVLRDFELAACWLDHLSEHVEKLEDGLNRCPPRPGAPLQVGQHHVAEAGEVTNFAKKSKK